MMNQTILVQAKLALDLQSAFNYFTSPNLLKKWLCQDANVILEIGGAYELFWDLENKNVNSTKGCKITQVIPCQLISFDWKGPLQFSHFMNETDPLTHVCITFFPDAEGTIVRLMHSGWRQGSEWQEAQEFFKRVWANSFKELEQSIKTYHLEDC